MKGVTITMTMAMMLAMIQFDLVWFGLVRFSVDQFDSVQFGVARFILLLYCIVLE